MNGLEKLIGRRVKDSSGNEATVFDAVWDSSTARVLLLRDDGMLVQSTLHGWLLMPAGPCAAHKDAALRECIKVLRHVKYDPASRDTRFDGCRLSTMAGIALSKTESAVTPCES